MTIAKTGNKILDDLARAKARNDAAERSAKARGKRSSGRAGKSVKAGKFRGAGRAGRAAAKRAGKGISAKYNKKGSNAKGAVSYALKDGADLIATNCGFDLPSMSAGLSKKLRSDIKDQIVHMSFSTPSTSGKASAIEWANRIEFIRRELKIDDSYSFVATRHNDAEHDHVHLFFNRISDVGERWKDNQIGLRLASLEQKIEKKFSLKLTRREDFVTVGNMSKKSIEKSSRRSDVQPVFLEIQTAIMLAKRDKPDVLTFVSRLADAGIAVRPNLQAGELAGFGYMKDGQSYTGKKLGANWAELKTEVTYVADEHFETLTNLKQLVSQGRARPARATESLERSGSALQGGNPEMERARRDEGKANQDDKDETSRAGQNVKSADRQPGGATDGIVGGVPRISGAADSGRVERDQTAIANEEPAPADDAEFQALKIYLQMEKASEVAVSKAARVSMSFDQRYEMNELIKTLRFNFKRLDMAERGAPVLSTVDADLDVPKL